METTFMSLPPEIINSILTYLPIRTLLAFGSTCRTSQALAQEALQCLTLAILPKDMHCHLALMTRHVQTSDHEPTDLTLRSSIAKPTDIPSSKSQNPKAALEKQISDQNRIATKILSKPAVSKLKSLSLNMYEIRSEELTTVLATRHRRLQELELKFFQPYIHEHFLPAKYWDQAPEGDPCWNALVGLGQQNEENLRLRNLQVLTIDRAGLTSAQLRKFVENNPRLQRLRLNNVSGVDLEFCEWLSAYCEEGHSALREVSLENCPQIQMQKVENFAWLAGISESKVKYLSLRGCKNVKETFLLNFLEEGEDELDLGKIDTIVIPNGQGISHGVLKNGVQMPISILLQPETSRTEKDARTVDAVIDVDPDYMASTMAVAA